MNVCRYLCHRQQLVLSIGDGGTKPTHINETRECSAVSCSAGNDKYMLQKSHIGVAISSNSADSGRSSAVLNCDVSIPSFAQLPRLIHVHGSTMALRFQGLILLDIQVCFLYHPCNHAVGRKSLCTANLHCSHLHVVSAWNVAIFCHGLLRLPTQLRI